VAEVEADELREEAERGWMAPAMALSERWRGPAWSERERDAEDASIDAIPVAEHEPMPVSFQEQRKP
jgi:hypothetical protein